MDDNMRSKIIWGGVCLALCIALGAVTAPLGIPLITMLGGGEQDGFARLGHVLFGGNMLASWQDYMGQVLASPAQLKLLVAWCGLVTIVIAGFAIMNRLNQPTRNVDRGILGDAKLIKASKEIRQRNDYWNGVGEPEGAGLVLSSSKGGYLYDSTIPHWAIVGKTGSGKSWLVVIQTLHLCMAKGWNLIVTGKDELLELTGEKAEELGYNRVIFDLKGYPCASRFNPVDLIAEYAEAGNIAEAQRTARQTAADLILVKGGENDFFPKAARSALTACLLIVAMADIPRSQKNMASVCNLVNMGTAGDGRDPSAPLKNLIRSDEVGPGHPAYAPASEFLSDGGMTTAGKNVLSTLKEALTIFNDEGIRGLTSESDVAIRDIVREKTVVYMHLLEEGDPYLVLMTVFLNQYWRVAQQEAAANGGRLPRETAIVGDEWGNLPAVSAMPEIVTLGRSYRLHAWCFTQDLKQWNKYNKPGDQNAGRDKILGSMGGKMALSLANPEDFQYFTRLAGKRTVRTQNAGTSKQGYGVGSTASSSESYTEHADDLIHEWEWQNLIPVRDGITAIKGGENSKPGREGIFRMPVTYASNTPAAQFFGLGSEDECDDKRFSFRLRMENNRGWNDPVDAWIPDFERYAATDPETNTDDDWSAWDGM